MSIYKGALMMQVAMVAAAGLGGVQSARGGDSPAMAVNLQCEYRVDPLGIGVVQPRLFWEMQDARRGAKQTAYQVLVASTPEKLAAGEGDLWDSGKVDTNQSIQVVYAGKPLESRMRCCWKVRLWDADSSPTPYSKPALWTMGLLKPADIQAKWIGCDGLMTYPVAQPGQRPPLTFDGCEWIWAAGPGSGKPEGKLYFRHVINIPKDAVICRAQFLTAAGADYEVFVNGKPASRFGKNQRKEPHMNDIGNQLGDLTKSAIGIVVENTSATPAGLCGKLLLICQEGAPMVFPIDTSWKVSSKKEDKWDTAAFDDSKWLPTAQIGKMGDKPWGKLDVPGPNDPPLACPLFRKDFQVKGPIRRATVYGSALGLYRLYINGKPVGKDYFTPGWTDYETRVYYQTYDVTDLVRAGGPNAIGGVLSGGWYYGAPCWIHWGRHPKLFAQLEIELADGTIQTVGTDGSWKMAFGPYIESGIVAGEYYDATKEIPGWATPGGFLDWRRPSPGQQQRFRIPPAGDWRGVAVEDKISAHLGAFPGVPARATGELKTQKITEPKPGKFVFDMGQNFAGVARLKVRGPAGTRVVLRHAEMLKPDGTIYTDNLGAAWATDTYVLKGEGEEIWQPHFTYHGFRYVEVTGYPGRPTEDAITGIPLNANIQWTGSFECSSPMVTKLYQNILWTQRSNFLAVPTDCPQRDERLGWTGDVQTFIRAATYNADVAAFFTKWLVDLDDAQGKEGDYPDVAPRRYSLFGGGKAAWADVGTVVPTTLYRVYDDRRMLEKQYPGMVRWVEYCRKHSKDLLRPDEGWGDWLSIKADTPKDVLATAWFAESTHLVARAARALGKQDDAHKYDELFRQIKEAFNKAYVSADGKIKGNTQTCYVLALWFHLLPEDKRPAAIGYLVDDIKSRKTHLSTGFVGTSVLMPTLSAVGQTPLAYKLLLNETFPSWGFSIKHGATTTWERWDGWTPDKGFNNYGMNSFSHYSFGAVARWMFQTVAGIDTAEPGFQHLLIRPQPAEGLTWVKASYHSIHGPITTEWRTEDGKLTVKVVIPANTTATVCLPVADPSAVTEGGRPAAQAEGVKSLLGKVGESRFDVVAGEYEFVMPWGKQPSPTKIRRRLGKMR
jgi:alpha-L-rhamnosidase